MADVKVTRLHKPKMVSVRMPEDSVVDHFDKLADAAGGMSRTDVIAQTMPQLLKGKSPIDIINRKTGFQFSISKPIAELTEEDYIAIREECNVGENVASEEELQELDSPKEEKEDNKKDKGEEESSSKGFKF